MSDYDLLNEKSWFDSGQAHHERIELCASDGLVVQRQNVRILNSKIVDAYQRNDCLCYFSSVDRAIEL